MAHSEQQAIDEPLGGSMIELRVPHEPVVQHLVHSHLCVPAGQLQLRAPHNGRHVRAHARAEGRAEEEKERRGLAKNERA
jgi:hypothetical protein